MKIQRKKDRHRKGSVILVASVHSYSLQQPFMERREYARIRLDRIVSTVSDTGLGRRVTKTERLGKVEGAVTIFILDADVRAEDLWRDHERTEWRSIIEARSTITQYRMEAKA